MGDPLAVLLVAGVHAVRVAVTAPAHGDAEPVQPALELVGVAAPGWARGWWEAMPQSLPSPRGIGNQEGLGRRSRASHSAAMGAPRGAGGVCGHPAGGRSCRVPYWGAGGCAQGSPGTKTAEPVPWDIFPHLPFPQVQPGKGQPCLHPPKQGHGATAGQQQRCSPAPSWPGGLTLVGAVGMSFITVVPTVVVPVARPVHGDAAPTVALELVAGAGVAAACLVAVVPAVVVCREKGGEGGSASTWTPGGGLAEAQRGEKGRDPR